MQINYSDLSQDLSARQLRADTVYGPIFSPFYKILISFFLFSVKTQTKQDQAVL